MALIFVVINQHCLLLLFSLRFDRTYASKYIPIIASVSEHQPPTWPSYFMDINVLAFLVPAGIIVSFEFSIQVCFIWYILIHLTWSVYFGRRASHHCLMQAPLWSFILSHQFIFLESW